MTPSQKETTKLYSNHFIKVRRMFFERCANEVERGWIVKGRIRLSIREMFDVNCGE